MQERPITGTTAWRRHEVVLEVPRTATAVAFGILLSGTGEVLLRDVALEAVTGVAPTKTRELGPKNLLFRP
jgi:hypothetical protein